MLARNFYKGISWLNSYSFKFSGVYEVPDPPSTALAFQVCLTLIFILSFKKDIC